MVLDRACPVCGSVKHYRTTKSAKTEPIECPNCEGKGYMSDTEPSVLLVKDKNDIRQGILYTMLKQRMYVVDKSTVGMYLASEIKRLYVYNVPVYCDEFKQLVARNPKEIHMYFD
jgi:excinuclease UvrABC ATPase subunit